MHAYWDALFVPEEITSALLDAGFTQPTPIQSEVLPLAIRDRSDILGAAPTGSGKTLAFGLPLLTRVQQLKSIETTHESLDVSPDPEELVIPIPNDTCPPKRKKLDGKKISNIYANLALIEELDVDSGDVCAMHSLLDMANPNPACTNDHTSAFSKSNRVYGLVLLPTRELAMQVCEHLRAMTKFMDPRLRIEPIVGGIAIQKQARLLKSCPDILVATPGRLWQFIQQEEPYVCTLRQVDVLVVDEGDRLVEANHFEELRQLFIWLNTNLEESNRDADNAKKRRRRQTLVFSATLTFVHQGALKPGLGSKGRKRHRSLSRDGLTKSLKLSGLRELLGLSPRAKIIDLSSSQIVNQTNPYTLPQETPLAPSGLRELRLLCPDQSSKDIRLFWFLAFGRYSMSELDSNANKQRCLIFLNSKAGVRRLAGVFRQLCAAHAFSLSSSHNGIQNISVLHADMVQKQRLRALERFQASSNGVLVASDVAARGLDLASMGAKDSDGVSWVVHFEVPRTAETYIHRRGRTARADRPGTSVLFVSPQEMSGWRRVAASLKLKEFDLPDFPREPTHFELVACERIVLLAKQLDLIQHSAARRSANESWFARAAKDADIDLDCLERDRMFSEQPEVKGKHTKHNAQSQKQYSSLLTELKQIIVDCQKSLKKKSAYVSSTHLPKTSKVDIKRELKNISKKSPVSA